jgi:hypothetical protein
VAADRRSRSAPWSPSAPQPDPFTGRLIGPSWERKPLGDLTDPTRAELLRRAAHLWAAEEQRLPITEVKPSADDERELAEILLRIRAGQFDGILDSPPARLIAVTATTGKKTRATPVATAYETNRVSHVGTLPELEQELTHWEEGRRPRAGWTPTCGWSPTCPGPAGRAPPPAQELPCRVPPPAEPPGACGVSSRRPHEPEVIQLEVSRRDGGG